MRRRSFLAGLSTVSLAATAGCAALTGDGSSVGPAIEIDTPALRDASTPPRLVGFAPETRVSVTATTTDGDGVEWQSFSVFEADRDGHVNLAEAPSVDGTYEGVAPMGWLWLMRPQSKDEYYTFSGNIEEIRIEAAEVSTDGSFRNTVSETVTRRQYADGVTKIEVDADDFVGVYFEPSGEGPHPPVLALYRLGGDAVMEIGELLASRGYATLAPKYEGGLDAPTTETKPIPLGYFDTAVDWLTDKPAVRDGDVGVYGWERGGELALLLGAYYDWAGVVISENGSGVVWNGYPHSANTAWTLDGDRLPHLSRNLYRRENTYEGQFVFREEYAGPYETARQDELAAATIPVEDIDAPVLLISGEDDKLWPSTMLSEHAAQRLRDADFDHEFEHAHFANAGHYILPPYRPTYGLRSIGQVAYGGTRSGNAKAGAEMWTLVRAYLADALTEN